jgi:hypothetical protein
MLIRGSLTFRIGNETQGAPRLDLGFQPTCPIRSTQA